jgi:pilus assembly protein CpaB
VLNKKTKTFVFLGGGIILLGMGVLVAVYLMGQINSSILRQVSTTDQIDQNKVDVVITTRDLILGELVADSDVTTLSIPAEFVPRDTLNKTEDAINKFVTTGLVQGEMLLKHNLADPTNINHDIAYILNDSHVLFAFPARDLMSVNSVIQRGDIVDILATISIEVGKIGPIEEDQITALPERGDDEEKAETRVLTINANQAVEITALVADIIKAEEEDGRDQNLPPTRNEVKVNAYLLALPPQDALVLKHLIDTGGKFDMVLRAATSRGKFDLNPVTKEYIVELYGLGIVP